MAASYIQFSVNGRCYTVTEELPRETLLSDYLRYNLGLTGTKTMCREGGCGICIVAVRAQNPTTGKLELFSVNSCLVLVVSCHGWTITTVEGTGNRLEGYNDIQKRIAAFNGTQCGYCTPGFVMQMYSLLDKNLTMEELEKSFGSNTCRCTGFRSILDTMKSFAVDASHNLKALCADIEDTPRCNKSNKPCVRSCSLSKSDWSNLSNDLKALRITKPIILMYENSLYAKAFDEEQIFGILDKHGYDSYMFIDGNTGKGIYENFEYPKLLIDIRDVISLKQYNIDQNLVLGGNITLEDAKDIFKQISKTDSEFSYLKQFVHHLDVVAHLPVRKIGSLAGNLMIKHRTPMFQSDIFLLLSTVDATVTLRNKSEKKTLFMSEFLKFDMTGYLIVNIELPPLSSHHILKTYKIMPRHQNALAIVNAAFLINMDIDKKIIQNINIAYGNISPEFVYANETQNFLQGKMIDDVTLQGAIKLLNKEIQPVSYPSLPSKECRKQLTISLFYKFILNLVVSFKENGKPGSQYRSGAFMIERPISSGKQDYQSDSNMYPITEPVPKIEAIIQASGEAEYVNDISNQNDQVFGAFVLSTVYSGTIDRIDGSEVLKTEGVLAVFTADDIPGKNSFTVIGLPLETAEEEILASGSIRYYGQPLAVVVANTYILAEYAASKVKVTYKDVKENPVTTIGEAKKYPDRVILSETETIPKSQGTDVFKVVKGTFSLPSQYHYYTEPLTTIVVPKDNGLEVYDTTQWIDLTQNAVASTLNMKMSDVHLKVRRVGGAFGGKISRNVQVACASALVAKKLDVTCRFILPMKTNLTISGKRSPCETEYEVGVDKNGKIQFLNAKILEDYGYPNNEIILSYAMEGFLHCYNNDSWDIKTFSVITDLPGNTYMRAPGTFEGINSIEEIMEHIAHAINKDPTEVRLANMTTEDNDLPELVKDFKKETNYEERMKEAEQFNKSNRWMKKAVQLSVMLFPIVYYRNYSSMVSIYRDGTVTVTTGGIEIGQGVNTKAAQVCASCLGIPLELVTVIPNYSFVAANNIFTGSSIVSESVCFAIIKACDILNKRLAPEKDKLTEPSWQDVIKQAIEDQVDLVAEYMMNDKEPELDDYHAYAVTVLELQLDIILGKFEILRVDILEDVGISTNPLIDVGQLEGAYVQGLGFFTTEKIVLDQKTGKLLSNRSLNYHVPLTLDIPIDFRVKFRYNSKNPKGVLGSKTVGEMGICSAHGVIHALRQCIISSRKDSGYDTTDFLKIDPPYDTETILNALQVNQEEFTITGKTKAHF